MSAGFADLRLAVISPFVDRRHGTERCLAEQLERFAGQPGAEIHLYAQRVEDLRDVIRYPASGAGRIVWHHVPRLPGPHILAYLWWFGANYLQRWWDGKTRGLQFDLTYSAGINAIDADAISIHVLFSEFYRRVRPALTLHESILRWPVILHRRLYYRLICWLERRLYPRESTALTAISQHTAACAAKFFQRKDVGVIRYGVDTSAFQPSVCAARRVASRNLFRLLPSDFCLLLIGNDWRNKGLDTLLRTLADCSEIPAQLLVVGSDQPGGFIERIRALGIDSKIRFLSPSADVVQFYAAADAYVAPSLEDAYGLPILEAMACGLPVIASVRAGASEILRDAENGLLLRDPEDARELAALLCKLYSNVALREELGREAAQTAALETWDRNAASTWEFLRAAHARKGGVPIE